jgi:parallel beta-helix repeat protein
MRSNRVGKRLFAGSALVALACAAGAATAPAGWAADTCNRWAATNGSDGSSGTQGAPYRSLGKLVASLAPGQTGCLPANQTYYAVAGSGVIGGGAGTATAPVTITSGPGGRAAVMGQLWLRPEAHDVTFTDLNFRGGFTESGAPLYTKGTHLIVHGDRIRLVGNDIADPRGICIGAGRGHATDPSVNDVAQDLVVQDNRIHDCGMDAPIVWSQSDSGSHGVYLENTLNARVTNNLIYRNRWRGLQLWPRNDGALIANNVFDENATHVNIGSSLGTEYGGQFVARNTVVRDNVFSGRVTTFAAGQNPSQVYGFFPAGSPTYGNVVSGNCFAPGDAAATGNGYALSGNLTAQAVFVNRAARDYRLAAGSPCTGKGPGGTPPAPTLTVTAPATAGTGDELAATVRLTNPGAAATASTVSIAAAGGKLLALTPSLGTCSATTCSATIPAGSALTVSVRLGATIPGTATLDATAGGASASATITVSGPACTFAGSDGADFVQGSAAAEVFCLFGGNDTVMPDAGNDVVAGGSGTDRLSYWNAAGPVVINLGQGSAWDAGSGTAVGWDTYRGVEWGTGSAFADTLVGGAQGDILDGLEGADELWGYGGDDVLKGWSGDDRLYGGDGADTLDGGDGGDACDQGAGTGSSTGCER